MTDNTSAEAARKLGLIVNYKYAGNAVMYDCDLASIDFDDVRALLTERDALAAKVAELEAKRDEATRRMKLLEAKLYSLDTGVWRDGQPDRVSGSEWFIAVDKYEARCVLKALPEDHSYDYTTADETYIKAGNVVKWMQFPVSHFLPPDTAQPQAVTVKPLEWEKVRPMFEEADPQTYQSGQYMIGNGGGAKVVTGFVDFVGKAFPNIATAACAAQVHAITTHQ